MKASSRIAVVLSTAFVELAVLHVVELVLTRPAVAHHSTAMFDREKLVTLTGTVKEVQWTNPHAAIYVETAAKSGEEPVLWVTELTSPGNLVRMGWSKTSVKVGDKVTVELNPLRDGKKGGWLKKVTLIDTGQTYTNDIFVQEKANLK
jgi:hypothetical protein